MSTSDKALTLEDLQKWETYRKTCASLHPTSPFAAEERVIDSWRRLCTPNEMSTLDLPKSSIRSGFRIKFKTHVKPADALPSMPEGCTPEAFAILETLNGDCNPFSPNADQTIAVDGLFKFLDNVKTSADVSELLPHFMQRWRWLCMGNVRDGFETASADLTASLIDKCCRLGHPSVALELLRFKNVYKLQPTQAAIEQLMNALLLRHVELCSQEGSLQEPSKDGLEKPTSVFPTAVKRRIGRRAYPFRTAPRLYYYNPLPAMFDPEPSVFFEGAHPELLRNAETLRLLPDDQQKKLSMMIQDAAAMEAYNDAMGAESPALSALTDMYRLCHYATNASPRYYGMQSSAALYDGLVAAGVLGGQEEGWRRSELTAHEAMHATKMISNSNASLLSLGMNLFSKQDAAPKNIEDLESLLKSKSTGADAYGVGPLASFHLAAAVMNQDEVAALRLLNIGAEMPRTELNAATADDCVQIRDLVAVKSAPIVAGVIERLGASQPEIINAALQQLKQTSVASAPSLKPLLQGK